MKIRIATMRDAGQLLDIYEPFIVSSAVSFETKVPSKRDFEIRISDYMRVYPWIVCEHQGKVIGYAYASRYRDRTAYQWSCECSVYLAGDFRRKGIAGKLYSALFEILRHQGFVNVYAVITTPNPASIKFHRKNGFKLFAVYKKVGCKFGRWYDVSWFIREVNSHRSNPENPKMFSKMKNSDAVKNIIRRHNRF
jgi:phosphinothricin acetyltransferase